MIIKQVRDHNKQLRDGNLRKSKMKGDYLRIFGEIEGDTNGHAGGEKEILAGDLERDREAYQRLRDGGGGRTERREFVEKIRGL
ncbi:hypothetical protein Csa_015883 [Cucumis sativus]|uniref:Uncharacterized protein n=1 Tax=Cucumis sativus TaxID=3659 RepID=A0A0A0K6T3_CUCSA|nr:hypothetical protein Csa_015883 [Cucumis sativus]